MFIGTAKYIVLAFLLSIAGHDALLWDHLVDLLLQHFMLITLLAAPSQAYNVFAVCDWLHLDAETAKLR